MNSDDVSVDEWLKRHLTRLSEAHVRTNDQLKKQAAAMKERCDMLSQPIPLQVGEVMRKRINHVGRSKIADIWSEGLFTIEMAQTMTDGAYGIKKLNTEEPIIIVTGHKLKR